MHCAVDVCMRKHVICPTICCFVGILVQKVMCYVIGMQYNLTDLLH